MARDWLKLASDAHKTSTSYIDANYRKKWDDALRMFQSRHPNDSKYNTEAYKHRSKIFRPKTRSLVRKHEAATASAFFSNLDVINTDAVNQDDPQQIASSSLMKEILQYRLTKTIPWFQVVCGGMQDAMTVGVVCSYQYWKYKSNPKDPEYQPIMGENGIPQIDETGTPVMQMVKGSDKEVIQDEPCIDLIPVENIRFDPGADWTNPAKSSPYLIRMIPMYVCDLKSQMDNGDDKTGKKWKKLTDGQIRSAMKNDNDVTKQTREMNRQDPNDTGNAAVTDFEIAWVHENFMRIDGDEVVYYTLGVEFLLNEPKPLKEVYFHGERPIIISTCVLETHKVMPESPVLMAEQLQREVNEVANQRIDNVKLVLNKRYIVKRGAQVDLKSILRNVPGSVTLANDPVGDIREFEFNDVTASSYQEQDRLNVDYDELTGNFSQGSIMTNRKIGETVGGMGMISQAANQITEYTIRTFTETWVEPVLRQLVKLEQKYETDQVVLAIAAGKAKLLEKYGISQVNDELLNQELTLSVNVGMGATDPTARLSKFMGALSAYANVAQMQLPNMNMSEIGKEVFALAGYRDGARFAAQQEGEQQNPELMQAQQQIQQAEQMIQELGQKLRDAQNQTQDKMIVAQTKQGELEIKSQELQIKGFEAETNRMKTMADIEIAQRELESGNTVLPEDTTIEQAKLMLEEQRLNLDRDKAQLQSETQIYLKQMEIDKNPTPKPPSKKEISIMAPSGLVYTGIIEDKGISIKSPNGGVYEGSVKETPIEKELT